jgi:creatinine amidohydrolase
VKQYDIILLSSINDFDHRVLSPAGPRGRRDIGHDGSESDLVDLSRIEDPSGLAAGVKGEDPRLSTAEYGEYLIETTVEAIGRKLLELGL